ncbi:peptidylprolyl isomerase [Pseudooceanicola sp.]|uniref:peptidylprolyl isomerase n=1 Tax=Pseudooceanicola sp. TaxID=1914328 RepID=UPI0035C74399
MTQRFTAMAAFAIALGTATPILADDTPTADTVVATVDGTEITLGHMILIRQALPQQYAQVPANVLFQGILDQLVQQTALADAYEGETPNRVKMALENEKRSLTAAEEVGKVLETAVTEEAIEQAYKDTYANAEEETEYKAAHILVETEDEAKAIVTDLEGGADFAATAQEKSTGPSGPNGGELGWFSEGMMVPEFEQAVMTLEPGAISAPVQTQFGWHVIKLEETRIKEAPALDAVRDELRRQVEQDVVKAHIDALVEKANVDTSASEGIDPALLNNIDLLE